MRLKAAASIYPTVLGISFDGLVISGIVNEFLNVAAVLRSRGFRVLFDFGYDITLGRTGSPGGNLHLSWVEIVRSIGRTLPPGYCSALVEKAFDCVNGGTSIASARVYDGICGQLAGLLIETFIRENVRLLVVENGTLPDNPLFTEAVVLAIAGYGAQRRLGKYVLWRDHDLMWSAEPHLYGAYPYPGVRKPDASEHINYAVATDWMRKRMQAWAPSATYHVLPNRFFTTRLVTPRHSFRAAYGIPQNAYLIARCTRVIPQKTVDRDLRLVNQLQLRLAASGDQRKVFLFVTGPTGEDRAEYARLRALESSLSIAGQVIWGDGLLPFNPHMVDQGEQPRGFSIADLLAEAELSSFLTSYDYEGFGNPPGEAMATGVPFISTTYELYHEVYGSKGAVAPLWPIDRTSSPADPIPDPFVTWTLRALTDLQYREQIIKRNLEVCKRFFSLSALDQQVIEIFGSALNPRPSESGGS